MGKKRKTREQKIISDLRRKLSLNEKIAPKQKPVLINPTTTKTSTLKIPVIAREKSTTLSLESDYSYLSRDLKKSSALIGLAILFQLVLYLALR